MKTLQWTALRRSTALVLASMLVQVSAMAQQPPVAATAPARPGAAATTTRFIPTRLGRLAVHTAGDTGPAVLFWPAVFSDSSIYAAQVEALRGRYRLVLIDGPGFGRSDVPKRPFTMESCADAAAEVLEELGLRQVTWVGTSWGGIVGVHFAMRHPQRVRALVLMNTPFDMPAEGPGFSDRMVVWAARWIGNTSLFANGVARSYLPEAWRNRRPDELIAFTSALKANNRQGMAVASRSVLLNRASVMPLLPQIKAPTLVVGGVDDPLYPVPTLKAAAARIDGARFVEIPSSGHVSAVDQPGQVSTVLGEFLEQVQ